MMTVPRHSAVPRRDFLRASLQSGAALAAALVSARVAAAAGIAEPRPAEAAGRAITIYKDPSCGCCAKWVEHLKTAGFTPTVHDTPDMKTVKASMGVPEALQSCHTARVGSYAIEGHVPADVIERFLKEAPVARGLAVPGMPMGSPGMEGPAKDKYDIVLFDKAGKTRVYASR